MIPDFVGQAVERLAQIATMLRQVGAAADLAAAEQGVRTTPAAFVLPLAERAGAAPHTAEFRQRVLLSARVVFAVSNKADARGDAARESLITARQNARHVIAGWVPEGCIEPAEFTAGQLLRLDRGLLWWHDDFATAYLEPV